MDILENNNWAQSAKGTSIALFASRPLEQMASERPIILMGGIHGDEPEGVWLAQSTLEFLASDAKSAQPQVRVPWILIPCLNVDGFAARTRVNSRGVDLNRNYPSRSWSPECEKERYNPGPSAGSEPEIQAVVKLIQQARPRLLIHCHSWEPCVVCAGPSAMADAERLSRSSGYKVMPEIGYPTPGSLSQYGWVDNQIPVICIEERDPTPQAEVWPHFAEGIRAVFLDASPR